MARYTGAYSAFVERISEVEVLLRMASDFERTNPTDNSQKINALCRGSIVLLSSHIEGYVKEVGELTLTRIYDREICRSKVSNLISYHASRDIIAEIKDTSDSNKIAKKVVSLIDRDLMLWEQTGPYAEPISESRFNKTFSSPSFQKIAAYIRRFGYTEYKKDLGSRLEANYPIVRNLIDHVVDTRNQIAHGDPTISKTPTDLTDAIPLLKMFCRETDDLFAAWCRENLCTIR